MAYKVLVVDDESSNLHVMRTILQDHYTLVFAKSGERAIELTLKQRPDLILLDIMMPGMNGFEVCKRLKQEPSVCHIPIVIVSALDEYQSEVEGLKVGAADFLIKPVLPELVRSRVANLLDEARAAIMKENYQLVMNQIAAVAVQGRKNIDISIPRIAMMCEWLAVKYGLTKVKAEDISLAFPLCLFSEIWNEGEQENNRSAASKTMSLFSGATKGFVCVAMTLLAHKNTRWDGVGSPAIAGEDIPEECRIAAVAQGLEKEIVQGGGVAKAQILAAIRNMSNQAGTLFDPRLIYLLDEHRDELCDFYQDGIAQLQVSTTSEPLSNSR